MTSLFIYIGRMWGSSHAEFLTKFFIIDSGQVWPVTAARYSPAQTCTGLGTPLAIPGNTNFDTFFSDFCHIIFV